MPVINSGSSATVAVSAGDTLTIQNPGGWAQVESPIGTRIWEGSQAHQTFKLPAGTAKITSVQGAIYYETAGVATVQPTPSISRLIPGKPLMRSPVSMTSPYTVTVTGTGASGTVVTRRGRRCIEVTCNATGGGFTGVYWPITSRTYTDKVHLVFEVENATNFNGGAWRFGLYTDSNFTVGMQANSVVGTANGWNGMHVLAPRATDWAAVGAGSFSSTMTYAYFRAQTASSPGTMGKIWIYEVAEAEKATLPFIVIGADDGAATWYSDGLPICEKYGIKSYLAYIHDSAMNPGATSMSLAQWQDALARGHQPVVHGCRSGKSSLRDYVSNASGFPTPYDAMVDEIKYNRQGMIDNGLDPTGIGRQIYVYPQGFHQPSGGAGDDTMVRAVKAAGIRTARIATSANMNGIVMNAAMEAQRLYLPHIGHSYAGGSEAANITAIVTAMQNEVRAGRSVILMFHTVRASPTIAEDISPTNLETLCSAAADEISAGYAQTGSFYELHNELDRVAAYNIAS